MQNVIEVLNKEVEPIKTAHYVVSQIPIRRQLLLHPPWRLTSHNSWKHTENIKRWECSLCRLRPTITSDKTGNKVYTKHHANFIRIRKAISRTLQHRSDPNGNIKNLSKHLFTEKLNYSLNKNLIFFSSPGQYN